MSPETSTPHNEPDRNSLELEPILQSLVAAVQSNWHDFLLDENNLPVNEDSLRVAHISPHLNSSERQERQQALANLSRIQNINDQHLLVLRIQLKDLAPPQHWLTVIQQLDFIPAPLQSGVDPTTVRPYRDSLRRDFLSLTRLSRATAATQAPAADLPAYLVPETELTNRDFYRDPEFPSQLLPLIAAWLDTQPPSPTVDTIRQILQQQNQGKVLTQFASKATLAAVLFTLAFFAGLKIEKYKDKNRLQQKLSDLLALADTDPTAPETYHNWQTVINETPWLFYDDSDRLLLTQAGDSLAERQHPVPTWAAAQAQVLDTPDKAATYQSGLEAYFLSQHGAPLDASSTQSLLAFKDFTTQIRDLIHPPRLAGQDFTDSLLTLYHTDHPAEVPQPEQSSAIEDDTTTATDHDQIRQRVNEAYFTHWLVSSHHFAPLAAVNARIDAARAADDGSIAETEAKIKHLHRLMNEHYQWQRQNLDQQLTTAIKEQQARLISTQLEIALQTKAVDPTEYQKILTEFAQRQHADLGLADGTYWPASSQPSLYWHTYQSLADDTAARIAQLQAESLLDIAQLNLPPAYQQQLDALLATISDMYTLYDQRAAILSAARAEFKASE